MEGMTAFRVTYDGPALEHHLMDARDLAPALLAMADLLEASCKTLYGDNAKPQINVKGSFKTGSFNIDFVTSVSWLKSVRDLFAGENATAIANGLAILGFLGFVGKRGLAATLKWLAGRQITQVKVSEESATIFVDDDSLDIELETLKLLRELPVRQALDRVLAPLDQPGIDTFAVGPESDPTHVKISSGERAYFIAPPVVDELLIEETRKMAFSIVALAFKEDNKWRLSDGAVTISAAISDAKFLAAVDQNLESFSKGDVLICEVLMRQWQTATGARTEYEVLKVLEHRRAATQIPLPGVDAPSLAPRSPAPKSGPGKGTSGTNRP